MHRAATLLLFVCLAAPRMIGGARAAELDFRLYVVGVPAADATFNIDMAARSYRIGLSFHTTGIVDVIASDRLDAVTDGTFQGHLPVPDDYNSVSRLRGQDRIVRMIWRARTPIVTERLPPNEGVREDVPPPSRANTLDILSAIVELLRQVEELGDCDVASRTYDGLRLQNFAARTIGEEELRPNPRSIFSGPALRCDFVEHTLGGFRLGAGRADDMRERRGTIWLAPLIPEGPRLPVRAALQTLLLGDATMYLTAANTAAK